LLPAYPLVYHYVEYARKGHGRVQRNLSANKPTPIQGGGKDHKVLFVNLLCLPNAEEEQGLLCDQCLLYVPNNEDQCQINFNKSQEVRCVSQCLQCRNERNYHLRGVLAIYLLLYYIQSATFFLFCEPTILSIIHLTGHFIFTQEA